MDKKNYNKPELRVVKLRSRVSLLAGSLPGGDPSDQGGSEMPGGGGARRASFSEFDGE